MFGTGMALAQRFAEILADTGVSHGLIGPREVPRLWERHLLNCAVIAPAFRAGPVIDVGSGGGLPGVVLAIVRPDLDLHLVEPMLRRTTWLQSVVDELALTNVTIHRGRAEEYAGRLAAPAVTARAVARLDQLARWCAPLLERDGVLIAMKGRSASQELESDRPALIAMGLRSAVVVEHGGDAVTAGLLEEPVLTVDLTFEQRPARASSPQGERGGNRASGRARDGARGQVRGQARRRAKG